MIGDAWIWPYLAGIATAVAARVVGRRVAAWRWRRFMVREIVRAAARPRNSGPRTRRRTR